MNICVCVFVYVCVCVILMMPSSSSLLGCQHSAGDCHTQQPPLLLLLLLAAPPNLAEIGHFSVSGQTIVVGTG